LGPVSRRLRPAVAEEAPVVAEDAAVDAVDAAAARAETVEVGEDGNEETPVIDVHAAHGGIHTWKDFWIHLGTITLGLLIAISLEQSAEWVHHRHERHQLEEDLRSEAASNHDSAVIDVAIYDKVIAWLLEIQRGVDVARASGGKAVFGYPARADGIPDSPRFTAYHVLESEAWTTAKESSLLVLLPRDEAEIHARVYIQSDLVESFRERTRELGVRQGAFETRFSHGTYPPVFDLSSLTPQQLDEYDALLADELETYRIGIARLKIFAAANDYVLFGGVSEDELRKAILKANMPQ
jgi:hypothetical protein